MSVFLYLSLFISVLLAVNFVTCANGEVTTYPSEANNDTIHMNRINLHDSLSFGGRTTTHRTNPYTTNRTTNAWTTRRTTTHWTTRRTTTHWTTPRTTTRLTTRTYPTWSTPRTTSYWLTTRSTARTMFPHIVVTTKRPSTTKKPTRKPTRKFISTQSPAQRWRVHYPRPIRHNYEIYQNYHIDNDRLGTFLLANLVTFHPEKHTWRVNGRSRHFDHYEVYYYNSPQSGNKIVQPLDKIYTENITQCFSDTRKVCPDNTNAVCFKDGRIICATYVNETIPCDKEPTRVILSPEDIGRNFVVDRTKNASCVDSWNIPCYRWNNVSWNDQCSYHTPAQTSLLRLKCLYNTTIIGYTTVANNTILPQKRTVRDVRASDPYYVLDTLTGTGHHTGPSKKYCVTIMINPLESYKMDAGHLLMPGIDYTVPKFFAHSLGLVNNNRTTSNATTTNNTISHH